MVTTQQVFRSKKMEKTKSLRILVLQVKKNKNKKLMTQKRVIWWSLHIRIWIKILCLSIMLNNINKMEITLRIFSALSNKNFRKRRKQKNLQEMMISIIYQESQRKFMQLRIKLRSIKYSWWISSLMMMKNNSQRIRKQLQVQIYKINLRIWLI